MLLQSVPTMSYPAFLDLVVTDRIISVTSYLEISADTFNKIVNPADDQSPPTRSLQFDGHIQPGQLPPTATGVYYARLPCARLTRPCLEGSPFGSQYAGRYFQAHSYSLIDLDDPSIRTGEKSDAAVWVCGIDYEGCLHPFYNAIAYESSTKMHPMRSVRNLGAPSCLFIYQPFADTLFTQCSMTLKYNVSKGFNSNISGWVAAKDNDYLASLQAELPSVQIVNGGGNIAAGATASVSLRMVDGAGNLLARGSILYLEETGGFLPLRRVAVENGLASFNIMATGLVPGQTFKVKVGFRTYSGVLDVPFQVV
jgi:hypothetical protein